MNDTMKSETSSRGKWIRAGLCALVFGFVAIPAARVYMYDRPLIESMALVDGDDEVNTVSGHGLANSVVVVFYRQRNFRQGDLDGTGQDFSWCGGYSSGWRYAGSSLTTNTGAWSAPVKGAGIVAYPTGVWTTQTAPPCSSGLLTEFLAKHTTDTDPAHITSTEIAQVPDLTWFRIKAPANGDQQGNAQGVVDKAYNATISIADGPNDVDSPHGDTTRDVNYSGFNCEYGGGWGPCPRRIKFKTSGGDKPAPAITVIQNNVFPNDTDPEFPYLLGQMQASAPGGSILVSGKRDRPNITGAATIKVVIKIPGFDCKGGPDLGSLFNFFGF